MDNECLIKPSRSKRKNILSLQFNGCVLQSHPWMLTRLKPADTTAEGPFVCSARCSCSPLFSLALFKHTRHTDVIHLVSQTMSTLIERNVGISRWPTLQEKQCSNWTTESHACVVSLFSGPVAVLFSFFFFFGITTTLHASENHCGLLDLSSNKIHTYWGVTLV